VADHPLRPATRRCHGKPLPYHLADGTQAPPRALHSFPCNLMKSHSSTRYCPPFPVVIPDTRTGYLRVTHPCATLLAPERAFAFDLHVLSLPLTFALSQDQTLHLKFVLRSSAPSPSSGSKAFVPAQVSFGLHGNPQADSRRSSWHELHLIQCSIASFCPSTNYPVFKDQGAFQTHSPAPHHTPNRSANIGGFSQESTIFVRFFSSPLFFCKSLK
jgi:hypothetical protein